MRSANEAVSGMGIAFEQHPRYGWRLEMQCLTREARTSHSTAGGSALL